MDKYTLAEWRRLRNISQSDLAEKAGISRPTIARYESDIRAVNVRTLTALLEALDIEFDQLDLNFNKGEAKWKQEDTFIDSKAI